MANSWWAGGFLLLVLPSLAAAQAPAAQPAPTAPAAAALPAETPEPGLSKGLDPGTTVDFDLIRGRFLNPLPFDVQFYAVSPVDEKVTAVTAKYGYTCEQAQAPSGRSLGRAIFLPPAAEGRSRSVELSVSALEPNKKYCFVFTLTLKPDLTKLRDIVATQLDLRLQAIYRNETTLTRQSEFDAFRTAVLSGIRDAARDLEIETGLRLRLMVPPDSFFAEPPAAAAAPGTPTDTRPPLRQRAGTPVTAINEKERIEFARLVTTQAGKAGAIDNFLRSVSLASNEFARLRAMPAFVRMVAQLRASLTQPLVQQRLRNEEELGFAIADPAFDTAQASGVALSEIAAATDPDKVWEPALLDSRVTNLDSTIAQLGAFRQLATDLSTPSWEPLRDIAGMRPPNAGQPANPNAVTAPEFVTVATQVERVRQALLEARGALTNTQRTLIERAAIIRAAANRIAADVVSVIEIDGDTTAGWETRARSYVSADVGLAWSNPIDSFFFYLGVNFYFGPVNKKAPLRWSEPGNFRKRFALMAAIPINSFSDTSTATNLQAGSVELKGVLGDRPLLLGAGLRINDLMRINGGLVFFKVKSPDPLVVDDIADRTWFVGMSIDWDLKGMFVQLGTPSSPPKK